MTVQLNLTNESEPVKKTPIIYKILVMAAMMVSIGGTLTGVMTYINLGYSEGFFFNWLTSFLTTALVMMPTGLVMTILMSKLVAFLFPTAGEKKKNVIIGLFMAVVMESVMALTTTANNVGFSDGAMFISSWLSAFAAALPIGLVIMTGMTLTIKPKIERFLKS